MERHAHNETGPAEQQLFTWLWFGGLSFRTIAKQTGRSPTTVRKWVRRLLGKNVFFSVMLVLAWATHAVVLYGVVGVSRAGTAGLGMRQVVDAGGGWEEDVAQAASQVVQRYLAGCHLVLAAPRPSRALPHLIRRLSEVGELAVFLQPCGNTTLLHGSSKEKVFPGNNEVPYFWREVWESSKATCRAFLLDLTTCGTDTAARVLSWSGLWLQPDTHVVMAGGRTDVGELFHHAALRNTPHLLYITHGLSASLNVTGKKANLKIAGRRTVEAYYRCFYCASRQARPLLVLRWNLNDGISENFEMFKDQHKNFLGHRMNIVLMPYFPYISYRVEHDASATTVHLEDSLNTRMVTALASYMNFTYEVREPADNQWGVPGSGGNWTGIVGTLQHELADFSMDLTRTPGRSEVVEYSRIYIDESIVILSSKPKPLPEYLSLIRPLEGEVWGAIVVCVMVWGTVLWVMERLSHWITGRRYFSFSSSIFYGWGLLLEDHPFEPPSNPASQILVGFWLLVYLILSTAYSSSLISHLVVKGKSSVINDMEHLAERGEEGWEWGIPASRMTGAHKTFFVTSPTPAIIEVHNGIKITETEEGMALALQGGFSYIDNYYFIQTLVSTFYTDDSGYTPAHISTTHYPLFVGNAWAFRPGAPFRQRFSSAIQQLLDSGLITFWMNDVVRTHVREERQASKEKGTQPKLTFEEASDGQVALGLSHLQGGFYVLFLGQAAASLSFLCERFSRSR
ncbi:glutamate receptor ionotropic, kainate 4-like [Portunus trituberculatus]|uniref:glutamate receptor ionotropic, kainate 4-like n=1 Tax=Portunus trituberculatus TaxID=210409 RepID=UPI001E1CBC29|nr:glutamate receptor ionotropic, kainate 4-like [Portunus trituberculatus]